MKKLLIAALIVLGLATGAQAADDPTDLCGAVRYVYIYDPCAAGQEFDGNAAVQLWTSNLGLKWRRDNPGEVAFIRAYDASPLSPDDQALALASQPGPKTLFGKALLNVIQAYRGVRGTGALLQ